MALISKMLTASSSNLRNPPVRHRTSVGRMVLIIPILFRG